MSYLAAIGTGLAPGESIFFGQSFQPTRKVFVRPDSAPFPGDTVIAYCDVVVCGSVLPSGAVCGRIRSIPITSVGVFINGVPESSSFGGWFIRLYALRRSNQPTIGFTVFAEQL